MNDPARRTFGYSADLEQRDAGELLDILPEVEAAGFTKVWTSDHFHPWFNKGARTGFAWSWIPEALRSTRRLQVGTGVTSTLGRYHPGVIAQASAYIARRFPGRFFLGLGTGEAMNEVPLGFDWEDYGGRASRLAESIHVIRRLWQDDFVTFRGEHFKLQEANIYSKPRPLPMVYLAANGPRSASMSGELADGMITFEAEDGYYTEVLFPPFEKGRAKAKKRGSGMKAVQLIISYDRDPSKALHACRRWAGALAPSAATIHDPRKLDALGRKVRRDVLNASFVISSSPQEVVNRLRRYFEVGFDHIVLLDSSPDKRALPGMMKDSVIPQLTGR